MEIPLGLLEDKSITTCGIQFIHTFAVVDFGTKTAYDIILGRPFMRQLKMIQDWGSNHLYLLLRHANKITRVSTADLCYKDVIEAPIREYDSNTTINPRAPAWSQDKVDLWMCGASKNGSQEETKDRAFE